MPGHGQPTPDLWEVIAPACAAASVGTVAAILGAIRQINPDLQFRYDWISLAVGALGAAAGWTIGRGLWRLGRSGSASASLRRRVVVGLAGLGALTVAGFALAASGLPLSKRWDMIAGSLMAIVVLSAIAYVLVRLARLFGKPDDQGPS
ncbi:MAG: hypothetical protein JNK85_00440 [Verrucomicrobiales bacterium]|nr:hypothetical protein [Verrucomicrobiales bacterium]